MPRRGFEIVRDRGQWMIEVARGAEAKPVGVHVLLAAMRGGKAELGPARAYGAPLPVQLPERERCRTEVPAVITWIARRDRRTAIAAADERWRCVISERFGLQPRSEPTR